MDSHAIQLSAEKQISNNAKILYFLTFYCFLRHIPTVQIDSYGHLARAVLSIGLSELKSLGIRSFARAC